MWALLKPAVIVPYRHVVCRGGPADWKSSVVSFVQFVWLLSQEVGCLTPVVCVAVKRTCQWLARSVWKAEELHCSRTYLAGGTQLLCVCLWYCSLVLRYVLAFCTTMCNSIKKGLMCLCVFLACELVSLFVCLPLQSVCLSICLFVPLSACLSVHKLLLQFLTEFNDFCTCTLRTSSQVTLRHRQSSIDWITIFAFSSHQCQLKLTCTLRDPQPLSLHVDRESALLKQIVWIYLL